MHEIIWDEVAIETLEKLETIIHDRIIKKVDELSEDPFSRDIKKLKGSAHFRLRIGDYRVIFSIEKNLITILKIGHRKNIYDR